MRRVAHAYVKELLQLAQERNLRAFAFLEAGDAEGHRKNCDLLWEVLNTITEAVGRERSILSNDHAA